VSRVAPVASEIAPVPTQITTILSKLPPVTQYFSAIGFDLPTVRPKFLLRSAFASILTILAHVGPCFVPILRGLTHIAANLFPVGANLPAIGPQLPALSWVEAAAI